MLRSRRRGDLQRYEIGVVMPMRMDFCGAWRGGGYSSRESSHDRDKRTQPGRSDTAPDSRYAKSVATGEQSTREASGLLNA
jgi:hypothetical protein